ncbi:uncharacterized protein LODBEIA_P48370 [Lodderomyces beijingensis]|uniref:Zn(2)-C6 fungal-type domain-containing protein n=1 Tax=Lodderomyces beijingensis TaxID=1775926 RepID=A0ABP0ZR21_9ASCO
MMTSNSTAKSIPSISDILADTGQDKKLAFTSIHRQQEPIQQHAPAMGSHSDSNPSRYLAGAAVHQAGAGHFGSGHPQRAAFYKSSDPPRKRSKISRACDACRKKKVKCNAEFSTTLNKVTQICNNCEKNLEECTFSRTPLKRGPSKGYIKDLEDRVEFSGDPGLARKHQHPAAAATANGDGMSTFHSSGQHSLPGVQGRLHNAAPAHAKVEENHTNGASNFSPETHMRPHSQSLSALGGSIKLPPLLNYNSKPLTAAIQGLNAGPLPQSNPSSPSPQAQAQTQTQTQTQSQTQVSAVQQSQADLNKTSPPIQGPFWKVPYEMPPSTASHRSSIASLSHPGQMQGRRRSSLDSVSSTSTTNSRIIPIIRPPSSTSIMSDSESEDFHSLRSASSSARPQLTRNNSQSLSPRNSVTSLSSLNGRMNKTLVLPPHSPVSSSITVAAAAAAAAASASPYNPSTHQFLSTPQISQINPHQSSRSPMELLKLDLEIYEKIIASSYPVLQAPSEELVNMIQSSGKETPAESVVECFHLAVNDLINFKTNDEHISVSIFARLQSIESFAKVNPYSRFIYVSSLLLVNYSLLLKGHRHSSFLAYAAAFLNDMSALSSYVRRRASRHKVDKSEKSNRMCLGLARSYLILDTIDSITSLSSGVEKVVSTAIINLLPASDEVLDCVVLSNHYQFQKLISWKSSLVTSTNVNEPVASANEDTFYSHFNQLYMQKFQVYRLLFNDKPLSDLSEIQRIIDLMAATVVSFANYLCTTTASNKNVVHPCLNAALKQLFFAIKFIKRIIDHLAPTKAVSSINHNLSISFNLLNLNLHHLQISEHQFRHIKEMLSTEKLDFSATGGETAAEADGKWLDEIIATARADLIGHSSYV